MVKGAGLQWIHPLVLGHTVAALGWGLIHRVGCGLLRALPGEAHVVRQVVQVLGGVGQPFGLDRRQMVQGAQVVGVLLEVRLQLVRVDDLPGQLLDPGLFDCRGGNDVQHVLRTDPQLLPVSNRLGVGLDFVALGGLVLLDVLEEVFILVENEEADGVPGLVRPARPPNAVGVGAGVLAHVEVHDPLHLLEINTTVHTVLPSLLHSLMDGVHLVRQSLLLHRRG
mmetsp:Transcript_23520/g.42419  ORF Transcript_23520/g.42419 Transcript_23520/m.42419 type:complete len:224 (+) Transcript_23520:1994-2665(+)